MEAAFFIRPLCLQLVQSFGKNGNDLRFTRNYAFKNRFVINKRYVVSFLNRLCRFTKRNCNGIVVQDIRYDEYEQIQAFVGDDCR